MADQDDREQRTEDATPRRREEARERGQVPMSSELMAVAGLAAGAGVLGLGGPRLAAVLAAELENAFGLLGDFGTRELDVPAAAALLSACARSVLAALALVVVPIVLLCVFTGYAQIGLRLSPKAIEVDPSKLDPIKGLQRVFSLRAVTRTGFSLAKVILITLVATTVAWLHVDEVVHVGVNELGPLLAALGVVLTRTAAAVLLVVLLLAVADVFVQRFQHERDLRMTRAEIKEEHRMTEGDPHVRARIRAVQREFAMRRMMSDVPQATVVVTNPTHYAVALRYEREPSDGVRRAPLVLAKGIDHLAQRIKEVARANGVACREDVPLARALYARVAVGQEIPEELYGAVAAVLATVYRVQEAQAS
jgi:flagellar biosynthesis protein FlhB